MVAHAIVDAEDYERLSQFRWCLASTGRPVRPSTAEERREGLPTTIYMSHEVVGRPAEGEWIQNISGDGLNCRRENFRTRLRYKDKWGETNGWRKYGMDRAQYESMLEEQEGVCAICKLSPEERNQEFFERGKVPGPKRKLHVDHNHTTNEVRGLLCWACNLGLGKFSDSPERLRAAADYLEKSNPFMKSVA